MQLSLLLPLTLVDDRERRLSARSQNHAPQKLRLSPPRAAGARRRGVARGMQNNLLTGNAASGVRISSGNAQEHAQPGAKNAARGAGATMVAFSRSKPP